MSNPNTFEALIERWRKERAHTYSSENADHYRGFDAGRQRCADELAALAPHYIHKDKVRELRKLCQTKLSTASLPTDEELLRWFIDWLLALLGKEGE